MFRCSIFVTIIAVAIALAAHNFSYAPFDVSIGHIEVLSLSKLSVHYRGKNAILIGGTRGVGYGIALAMAKAGASVTLVGRSEATGRSAAKEIRAELSETEGVGEEKGGNNDYDIIGNRVRFMRGDIGTVCAANDLVERLATAPTKYDYLVVTAATFPDWSAPTLLNEDGVDQSFAIAVVGRFIIYNNMRKFMRIADGSAVPRVLNVLASGKRFYPKSFDRELAAGKREAKNLIEAMMAFAIGNEIMQIALDRKGGGDEKKAFTRVSTHPGLLVTDLHRGQGIVMDTIEPIAVALKGKTPEECGMQHASILASNKLNEGEISYVDDTLRGRLRSVSLDREISNHLDWLWAFLNDLIDKQKSFCGKS